MQHMIFTILFRSPGHLFFFFFSQKRKMTWNCPFPNYISQFSDSFKAEIKIIFSAHVSLQSPPSDQYSKLQMAIFSICFITDNDIVIKLLNVIPRQLKWKMTHKKNGRFPILLFDSVTVFRVKNIPFFRCYHNFQKVGN